MSMVVDKPSSTPGVTIRPRTPATWIPDERVQRCFACNIQFSTFRRKHHCRSCGRIFCHACSSYYEVIPSYFRSYTPSIAHEDKNTAQRTCATCANQLRTASNVEWLVYALSVMPITFPELYKLRVLSKMWNDATNTLLGLYRGLQYKLPCQPYSRLESNFLWTHHKSFIGHIHWQMHVMASLAQQNKMNDRTIESVMKPTIQKINCRRLLCSRKCHPRMSLDDILRLGMTGSLSNHYVQKWVILAWSQINPKVHIRMMNWWVYFALRYRSLFKDGLIPMARNYVDVLYALWFECNLQTTSKTRKIIRKVQKRLKQRMKPEVLVELQKSEKFVGLLVMLNKSMGRSTVDSFFSQHRSIRLPWDPSIIIVSIDYMQRLNSSSRPLKMTCRTDKGLIKTLLLKNEDVRTDRLAMTIGFFISMLTPYVIVKTYEVFPVTPQMGCIEMVPNTTTLYDVREKGTLLNFTMTLNPSLAVRVLRERLITSCAGACLLAFTMGLGDRHLENMMVTSNAELVHVDFGWVFGDDPKHIQTPMRITEDMVDAMGGRNSTTFSSFVQITQKGYEHMRQHASFWYHMLAAESFIFERPHRPWKRIRDHVLERFVPGEWDNEASLQIQTVVQKAAEPSVVQRVADFTHYAANHIQGIFRMDL